MNRRSILRFLGLAPTMALAPAAPAFASGGIIARPLRPYTIGEAGAEMVLPLKRMEALTLQVDTSAMNRHIAEALLRAGIPLSSDPAFVDGDGI